MNDSIMNDRSILDLEHLALYRDAGVIWLIFLIGPLHVFGVWFSEDQRANIMKTHVENKLDYVLNIIDRPILNSEHEWKDMCI
jgi:hypothetical protein